MKRKIWIFFFLLILFGDLLMVIIHEEWFRTIFKTMLMPILAVSLTLRTTGFHSSLKKWIYLALLFSWFGDILLLFEDEEPAFFILGLGCFLLAQIFYILFFHFIRIRESVKGKALLLVLVVIYYAVFISILSPQLGEMKLPVRIYGVVISFMLMLALHMLLIRNRRAGWWMAWGAILFIISDTILAINKFYISLDFAPILIMLTYGLAQLNIVEGGIEYIRGRERER
jgi:uncharacterized membrane protein YhhN